MFKCEICEQSSRQRFSIIQESRSMSYTNRFVDKKRIRNGYEDITVDSKGWEIAKEIYLCSKCYKNYENSQHIAYSGKHVYNIYLNPYTQPKRVAINRNPQMAQAFSSKYNLDYLRNKALLST